MTRRQTDPTTIGGRLKIERERLGMSQSSFAAIAGASKGAQLKWENGNSFPTADIVEKFAGSGADAAFIITGERHAPRLLSADAPSAVMELRAALTTLTIANRRALLLDLLAQELAG